MAPAKVSALTLKVPPLAEVATGASTGIISLPSTWLSTVRSTFSGSPTKPRSTTFSMLESGSTTVRVTLRAVHHVAVLAAQPDGLAAGGVDVADDLLVDRAGQHHLDDLDGRGVGDAQAGGEFRLDAELLEHGRDLRAAAVHHHRIDRGLLQQHDVAGEIARGLLLAHGMAAVFDDDDLLVVALHVRQRLRQDARLRLRDRSWGLCPSRRPSLEMPQRF